jgi:hypothetical protein
VRTSTSPSLLVVVAVAAGLVTNLAVTAAYGALPSLPASAGVVLAVLGGAEIVLGFVLRARIARRKGSKPVDALSTARAVALAKASSLAGALVGGAWAGLLAYLLPRRVDLAAAAGDTPSAVLGVLGSAVLVGGGLWLEYCCRTPDDPDAPPRSSGND